MKFQTFVMLVAGATATTTKEPKVIFAKCTKEDTCVVPKEDDQNKGKAVACAYDTYDTLNTLKKEDKTFDL